MTAPRVCADLAITDLDQYMIVAPPEGSLSVLRSLYAPIDKVHEALLAVIGSAKHSIVVSMFGYDDDAIAEMLDKALQDPAMYVQITLDSSQAGGVHEKAILEKYKHEMAGNSVAVGRSERGAIVHRKMVIVDGLWWMGGSTNWSVSGETLQANELTIIRDALHCTKARSILDVTHDHILAAMAKAKAAA